jgi:predicted nicotinamide N-methyase
MRGILMDGSGTNPITAVPGALLRLGCALMGSGKGAQAHGLLQRLTTDAAQDPELSSAERIILSHRVPHWHSAMLADQARNEAFDHAIRNAVTPDNVVLDIGTGSGLLAMMAARAGAAKVVACEAHTALAETAKEIIAANGFGDVVQVIGKPSTELDPASDLSGGADLIIAEVFSDDLLNEGALATMLHARKSLGRPAARIIPARASVRIALAQLDLAPDPLADVSGFDLCKFRKHVAPARKLRTADKGLRLASDPTDLFSFDFSAGDEFRPERKQIPITATHGSSNGIVQWIRLQLDEEVAYENRPGPGPGSHWAALFYPFEDGREVQQGSQVTVNAAHDLERLQIWFS